MSEVSVEITVSFESAPPQKIVSILGPADTKKSAFNSYTVQESAAFNNIVHAYVVGGSSFELSAFVDCLKEAQPASLLVDADLNQVGESFELAEVAGKKASKAAVIAKHRKTSTAFDAYLALSNDEGERLLELAQRPDFDFSLSANGLPVLIALMVLGKTKALSNAIKRGADLGVKCGGYPVWVGKLCVDPGAGLLAVAFAMRSVPLVKLLLRSGVDLTSEDEWGTLPLHQALGERVLHKFVPLLLDAGADVNQVASNGWTPLLALLAGAAPAKNKIALAEQLMEEGADIHYVAPDGVDATWTAQGGPAELSDFVGQYCKERTPEANVRFYDQFENRAWALEFAMQRNDLASFRHMLPHTELSDAHERHVLQRTIESGRVPFLEAWVADGRPINRAIQGVLADRYAKASQQPKAEAFLRQHLQEFRKEGEQAILRTRPVYDEFVRLLEEVDKTKSKDLSKIEGYLAPDVNETIRGDLGWWARFSVAEEAAKPRVNVSFDHNLRVTYVRRNRFTTLFEATLTSDVEPKVCDLRMGH